MANIDNTSEAVHDETSSKYPVEFKVVTSTLTQCKCNTLN